MYYAHKSEDGRKQTIKEHLENVAALAEEFSVDFLKPIAYAVGYMHDIGKYSKAFQRRLEGSSIKYEHSSCGAIEYSKIPAENNEQIIIPMIEYCIAGHHTGLPDGGSPSDSPYDDNTLYSRLGRKDQYTGDCDYSSYLNEIKLTVPDYRSVFSKIAVQKDRIDMLELYAFFTRYLFSCLTDADFLDTERFCVPKTDRSTHADFSSAENALNSVLNKFSADTALKAARSRLQRQAFKNAFDSGAISILNMPTGSGKTLCSLKIALQKVIASGGSKKRIIYVIPYTSIIEQTAELFENIIGKHTDILQHHSNYCFDDDMEMSTVTKLKKASENWDVPVVITTSIQFFQSLYHYKGSGLRKLHNIGDSVIIFDEIHLLPVEMLQPCLRGIGYITEHLNSEAVFLSATMPDYSKLFNRYIPGCKVIDLMKSKEDFVFFEKCRYINLGRTDFESVLEKAAMYTSSLIIVNSRRSARDIYNNAEGKKYHLSTYMTPYDRSNTIKSIKHDLANGKKITVVSTSLVEAGVDFDFEAVFRQLAGLDSVLQAGGRCNREGRRETGDVYIFDTDEKAYGDMSIRSNITRSLLKEFEKISSAECIEEYYNRLFGFNEDLIDRNSIVSISKGIDSLAFREYARSFKFIKNQTIGIIINNSCETEQLIDRLRQGDYSVRRKLQKYTVGLKIHGEFDKALSMGLIKDTDYGIYILSNNTYYNSETGLCLDMTNDIII